MEAVKKQTLFSVLFGNNVMTYSENIEEIRDEELKKAISNADKMGEEVIKPINSENNSSKKSGKNGGLSKKIKTPTIDVHEMSSEKLEEMRKKLQGKERE